MLLRSAHALLALAALTSTSRAEQPPPSHDEQAREFAKLVAPRMTVQRVIDGDTLKLSIETFPTTAVDPPPSELSVRLLGIDCPESRAVSKCGKWREGLSCKEEVKFGKRAGARTKALLPLKTSVTLMTPPKNKKDRYGRTLGYVMLPDGRDVGLELVKEGLCKEWSDRYPHPRQDAYRAAVKR